MMKKEYMNPEMEIVNMEYQQMLALSDPPIDSTSDPVDPNSGADAPEFVF